MDNKALIKRHEAAIEKINTLLSHKSARDFKDEATAAKWYQRLCRNRHLRECKIKTLKADLNL